MVAQPLFSEWVKMLRRMFHCQSNYYDVIDVEKHSEYGTHRVVYRPLYSAGDLWVGPFVMCVKRGGIDCLSQSCFAYTGK